MKDISKHLIGLALLGSFSGTAFSQTPKFEGFSVSLGGGASYSSTDWRKTSISDPVNINYNSNYGASSYVGVLQASYSKAISTNFLVGLGVSMDMSPTKSGYDHYPQSGCDYCADFKIKNHYSIFVKPEYLVSNNTGIYLKLGYDFAKSVLNDPNGQLGVWNKNNEAKNIKGISYGLGMKTYLTNNLFASVEVYEVKYGGYTLQQDSDISMRVKLKTSTGLVSVGYSF